MPDDSAATESVAIDYVDFVRWHGRSFTSSHLRGPGTVPPDSQPTTLGDVVFTTRCSLSAYNDRTHQSPPDTQDGDSAFLSPGTPVYSVVGWSSECRLAARTENGITIYLADSDNPDHYAPAACALDPSATPLPSTAAPTTPAPTPTGA